MNEEEYRNKTKIINDELDDLKSNLLIERVNFENNYDDKRSDIKKRIEENEFSFDIYKSRAGEALSNMDNLHNSRDDNFKDLDNYINKADKVYESHEKILDYYQNIDNQLHQEYSVLELEFNNREDQLLADYLKVKDQLDDLENNFKRSSNDW